MTGFLFLDKDEGMTSFLAAKRAARLLGIKKAGHTGTLDPMATGVMVVALNGATRFIELIDDHDKGYKASFVLGKTTDTLDITGKVLSENEVSVSAKDVEAVLSGFIGEISQLPPMYSAIKKDGVRLYDLARKGIEVERESRLVKIHSLTLTKADDEKHEYEIEVFCSKGTYIRTLIDDIGKKLSCGAVMTSLRRIRANSVSIEDCVTLAELEKAAAEGKASDYIVSTDRMLDYKKISISSAQARRFSNGGELDAARLRGSKEPGLYRVYSPEGDFLGVGELDESITRLSVKRVYVSSEKNNNEKRKGSAVALGFFDGLHQGHRAVLDLALKKAKEKDLTPCVTVFDVHPQKAISGVAPSMLMSDSYKREKLSAMGFELFDFEFYQGMNYTPEEFEEKILLGKLNAKVITCGRDFRYGKNGMGNFRSLSENMAKKGVEVFAVEPVLYQQETVSSTAIRKLISDGDITKANKMLGYDFTYKFEVIKGDGIGRAFGFPTINQFFPEGYTVPRFGVYVSVALIDGKKYPSVTNVGVRPTVSGKELRSETCILDFSGDLYGKEVEVSLMEYLRPEEKFSDIEALKQAIDKDIKNARKVFKVFDNEEA